MAPTKVWLDCDPGHDDAMAIILAGHHDNIELIGVSTVHGNQTVEKTTRNALTMLAITGQSHIGVVKGAARPLVREAVCCPEIHGDSGLDSFSGTKLPAIETEPLPVKHAVLHMYEVLTAQKERTVLCATGSLTNVALLLTMFPDVKDHLESIVLMGGAVGVGNTGPLAEFNIQTDPEAASIVFESGAHVVMIPLNVTHEALVTADVLRRIRAVGAGSDRGSFIAAVEDLMLFFRDTYKTVFRMADPPLHDPCAVAYIADPSLFETQFLRVDIDMHGPLTAGATVADLFHMSGKPPQVHVAMKMDVQGFWAMFLAALARADAASSIGSVLGDLKPPPPQGDAAQAQAQAQAGHAYDAAEDSVELASDDEGDAATEAGLSNHPHGGHHGGHDDQAADGAEPRVDPQCPVAAEVEVVADGHEYFSVMLASRGGSGKRYVVQLLKQRVAAQGEQPTFYCWRRCFVPGRNPVGKGSLTVCSGRDAATFLFGHQFESKTKHAWHARFEKESTEHRDAAYRVIAWNALPLEG